MQTFVGYNIYDEPISYQESKIFYLLRTLRSFKFLRFQNNDYLAEFFFKKRINLRKILSIIQKTITFFKSFDFSQFTQRFCL